MPYIILLLLFAGFVVWNGSVVLGKRFNTFNRYGNLTAVGDKSAHTATIHLPQMLYVWPYIAFFSAPLLVGPLLGPVLPILPKRLQAAICENYVDASKYGLPTIITSGLFITLGLIAVYFNTIIHPYTLADNRHYVFYVFRIFRLYPATKYLAVPVYFVCAWLSIQSLASPSLVGRSSALPSQLHYYMVGHHGSFDCHCSSCRASLLHHSVAYLEAACATQSSFTFV
jgi:alpha-1,2-glucosyltransferase